MTFTADLSFEEDQILDELEKLEARADELRAWLRDVQAQIADAEAASDRAWYHMGVI